MSFILLLTSLYISTRFSKTMEFPGTSIAKIRETEKHKNQKNKNRTYSKIRNKYLKFSFEKLSSNQVGSIAQDIDISKH